MTKNRALVRMVFIAVSPFLLLDVALPCVPVGGTVPVTVPRPALPAPLPGAPGPNAWGNDAPTAMEDDPPLDADDPMGDATPDASGNSATVNVTNENGNLSGPNGVTQNGGAEGSKIEVKICWSYWALTKKFSFRFTHTGFTYGWSWAREKKEICNPPSGVDVEGC